MGMDVEMHDTEELDQEKEMESEKMQGASQDSQN